MTRTEELLALAEAALEAPEAHFYQKHWQAYIKAANPETIRQLVELVRLQNSALKTAVLTDPVYEALEAFNKWEGE